MHQADHDTRRSSLRSRLPVVLRNTAWLLLAAAILQRYAFKLGGSPRKVMVITVGLLLLALAIRIVAWRLVKSREQGVGSRE